jgi:integrase
LAEGKVGFQNTSIFDKAGSQEDGKSDSNGSTSASPLCPQCGSTRLYRDGLRYLTDGSSVQRWLCRDCAYRFSEKPPQKNLKWQINTPNTLTSKRRICANRKEAKNLTTATETKTVAGERSQGVKGLVTQFMAYLEREGYCKDTLYPYWLGRLAKLGANLLDPESVKKVIGKQKVKDGTKIQYVAAYAAFATMLKIKWEPPKYTQEEILPFIPDEKELDQLIAFARSRRMATFLQCFKETWADPSEALGLRWIDISGNIITINKPVKGHLPRQLQVSKKLIAMINALPKKSERIFPMTYRTLYTSYAYVRKRAAEVHQNPRLLAIELRSFRHWGGTMLAHYTNGNVLKVKEKLGHKSILSTMKYIRLIHFEESEFEVATAETVEEAKQKLAAGFDFVTEKAGIMLFRRPKRFSFYGV